MGVKTIKNGRPGLHMAVWLQVSLWTQA